HLLRDPHAEAPRPGHEGHRAQGGATRDTSLTRASIGSSRPSTSPLAFRNDHVESYQKAIRRGPQEAWTGKRGRTERGNNTSNYPAIGALDRGGTSRRSWPDGSGPPSRLEVISSRSPLPPRRPCGPR